MIRVMKDLPESVVGFSAIGDVKKEDYEHVLIPHVEAKLKEQGRISVLYHIGPKYRSFKPGAAWDDALLGLRHLIRWRRVAIVTDVKWIRKSTRWMAFLMPGHVRVFRNEELPEARSWLGA